MGQAQTYHSMTAYASVDCSYESRSYKLNLRSVNHKNLKINIRHPFSFQSEDKIRSLLRQGIQRGAVDLIIEEDLNRSDFQNFNLWIQECKQEKLPKPTWADFYTRCQYSRKSESLDPDEEEEIIEVVEVAIERLLDKFIERRADEGHELIKCISKYLDNLKSQIGDIIKVLPRIHEDKKNQLSSRINEISGMFDSQIREDDVLREVAIMIEKLNVTEECDRILVHLNNFNKAIYTESKDGKYLDFLCQEINREINTLTTKSQSTLISESCIEMKSDLEKIREQVQNLA